MAYDLSKKVGGPILHLAFRPWVEGRQYVPESGAAILASNHLSIMDSVFLPLVLDRDVISWRSRSTSPAPARSTG